MPAVVKFKRLRIFNVVMGFLHLAQAVVIYATDSNDCDIHYIRIF